MSFDRSSNHLLQLLDGEARAALSPAVVQLRARELLYEPGLPALHAYFPVSAVISLVSIMADGTSAEVGVVGREGMVGLAGLLGTVESSTAAIVQISGLALKIPTALLRNECLRRPTVRAVLDLYTEARLIQVAQTAACNRLHSVEARLARGLLAIADRIDIDQFAVPQEFLAQMLGVHRPTVTLTLQGLRDAGVISYRGRSIVVADRQGLERLACECYGVLRREFDRLLRPGNEDDEGLAQSAPHPATREGEPAVTLETMREIAGRLLVATIREQEARDEAEAANRTKDYFVALVSHELRTPLNAILGWSSILTERRDAPSELGLTVIQRNAQALLRLVEELLDAARLTSGSLSIQPSVVSLDDILLSAVDKVTPAAVAKTVALRLTIPHQLPPVLADTDRLRQAVLNTLTNALKFTDPGGSIDVSAIAFGNRVLLTIQDTGISKVSQHGLGFGLAIARELVELHGGTLLIGSAGEGLGTTCTIELPTTAGANAGGSLRAAVVDV